MQCKHYYLLAVYKLVNMKILQLDEMFSDAEAESLWPVRKSKLHTYFIV